jgi:hypothetical protein
MEAVCKEKSAVSVTNSKIILIRLYVEDQSLTAKSEDVLQLAGFQLKKVVEIWREIFNC